MVRAVEDMQGNVIPSGWLREREADGITSQLVRQVLLRKLLHPVPSLMTFKRGIKPAASVARLVARSRSVIGEIGLVVLQYHPAISGD